MIELTRFNQLAFPLMRVVIPMNHRITPLAHNRIRVRGKIIDASNMAGCTYIPASGKLTHLKSIVDLANVPNTGPKSVTILVDFTNKRIYRCMRNVQIRFSYKPITHINDYFIRVDTIPHPIRHFDGALQEEGIERMMLYARIAFVDREIYYMSSHNNKGEPYRVRI